MYDDVVYFSSFEDGTEKDQFGDPVQTEKRSEPIFAELKSIGQTEFYQAQTNDKKPEIKFKIADYLDYQNQKYLIHDGIRYKILRTFRTESNELEITCYGGVRDAIAAVSDEDN